MPVEATLLLLGGDSPAVMARGVEQVHRHLPVARIAIMPGQRHVAIDTAPELFASLVREFLAG